MGFFRRKVKVGLALGGGAARGVAHLGVIKALCDNNIPIHYLAGTSAGSFVGGLYSAELDIDKMIHHVKVLKWLDLAGFHFSRKSMISSHKMERFIKKLVGDLTLKDLKIPFVALSTDIKTGKPFSIKDPDISLATAIRASSAFPGIYPPVVVDGKYLVDGGASSNVPVSIVKEMGATVTIAVDVIPDIELEALPKNIPLMVDRGLDLLLHRTDKEDDKGADIVLKPITEYIHSFDIKKTNRLIELGEMAVKKNLDHIKKVTRVK